MTQDLRTDAGPSKGGLLRWLRTALRAAHIISFSVFVGGVFFTMSEGALEPEVLRWLYAALFTGMALAATDIPAGIIWFRQLRGIATMAKLLLLLTTLLWPPATMPILFVVLFMSAVVSHMPGRYRYWVVGRGPGPSSGGKGMTRG